MDWECVDLGVSVMLADWRVGCMFESGVRDLSEAERDGC